MGIRVTASEQTNAARPRAFRPQAEPQFPSRNEWLEALRHSPVGCQWQSIRRSDVNPYESSRLDPGTDRVGGEDFVEDRGEVLQVHDVGAVGRGALGVGVHLEEEA